jgi:hypothetical protein
MTLKYVTELKRTEFPVAGVLNGRRMLRGVCALPYEDERAGVMKASLDRAGRRSTGVLGSEGIVLTPTIRRGEGPTVVERSGVPKAGRARLKSNVVLA